MEIKAIKFCFNLNYLKIPVTQCTSIEDFNSEVIKIENLGFKKGIKRTPSGGISIDNKWELASPSYDVTYAKNGVELLVISTLSTGVGTYRIQFVNTDKTRNMSGRKAFFKFKSDLKKKCGINLEKYAIMNGEEVKATIPMPPIRICDDMYKDLTLENVHHLDINSSYPAGLVETHPEFAKLINLYYNNRKKRDIYKAILNYSIGFMQSKYVNYKYAQLSKDAITVNNTKIEFMCQWLLEHGRIPVLCNTDGVWFKGPSCANYNSKVLGEWKQDHTNCKFRVRTKGCYEFIEDGVYTPVVRGRTMLDYTVDREHWQWGDIYKKNVGKIEKISLQNDRLISTYTEDYE